MKIKSCKFQKIQIFLILALLVIILCLVARSNNEDTTVSIVNEWIGRKIEMPNNFQCNVLAGDTAINIGDVLLNSQYKILLYVDSVGCISCKLHLPEWNRLIKEFEDLSVSKPVFLFFFHLKDKKELSLLLKRENFNYPVFIDMKDELNKLNNFSTQSDFQCFLLDKNNNVLLVGNPVKNFRIKDLYLKIILNQELEYKSAKQQIEQTEVKVDNESVSLGNFDWQVEQRCTFVLKNTGVNLLVIDHVSTSCGCTTIGFSKEPVRPGDSLSLYVVYKAYNPEYIDKTIKVYCNAKSSPAILRINGTAK